MAREFEGEVKRVKGKPGTAEEKSADPHEPHPDTSPEQELEDQAQEKSPLETVGGTPIIEKTPEG